MRNRNKEKTHYDGLGEALCLDDGQDPLGLPVTTIVEDVECPECKAKLKTSKVRLAIQSMESTIRM